MNEHLERLARRVADDPFFLAPALALYAHSAGLNDLALAAHLECPMEVLPLLRLCRMPRAQPPGFAQDVDRIAERFAVRADVLAEVVRRGQGLLRLRQAEKLAQADSAGFLLAARDQPPQSPPERPSGETP